MREMGSKKDGRRREGDEKKEERRRKGERLEGGKEKESIKNYLNIK